MRDNNISSGYFANFINLKRQQIEGAERAILNGELAGHQLDIAKYRNFEKSLQLVVATYSAGWKFDQIKREYDRTIVLFKEGWVGDVVKFKKGKPKKIYDQYQLNEYCYFVWLVSLNILLMKGKYDSLFLEVVNRHNISDELILRLVHRDDIGKRLLTPTTYKPFATLQQKNTPLHSLTEKQLISYLNSWYKGTKLLTWHRYIESIDNTYYFGYWSFEAAAVALIAGLNDNDNFKSPYFPNELFSYSIKNI